MKYKVSTFLLLMCLFGNLVSAQEDYYSHDSLIIERINGQKITLAWNLTQRLNEGMSWKNLIYDFHSNFKKVYNDIPDFDFYTVKYIQNKKLIIDEVTGRETYAINEDDELKYTKSNSCKLIGKNVIISIEFDDKKELLDSTLIRDIEEAAKSIKYKFYFSNVTKERHYYSIEKGEIIKNPKAKIKFVVPIGSRIGIAKNRPYVEFKVGAGILIGGNKIFSIDSDWVHNYNAEKNKTESDVYLGLNFSTNTKGVDFGLGLGYKISSGIEELEDMKFRSRFTVKPGRGIVLGVEYYLRSQQSTIYGFNVGFEF